MRSPPEWPAIWPSASRRPPSTTKARKPRTSRRGRTTWCCVQAHDFARQHKLNLYTKARLANRFKWELLEAGYPKGFVDSMTYDLAAIVAAAESEQA
jgi:hypothetical protein